MNASGVFSIWQSIRKRTEITVAEEVSHEQLDKTIAKDSVKFLEGTSAGAAQAVYEPFQPTCDVEIATLSKFEILVVIFALSLDLWRHAVEAMLRSIRARKRHVSDRTRYASIAILKGVNGDEPKMSYASFEDRVYRWHRASFQRCLPRHG